MKRLTYFTPTYNRKNLLKNLYESLLNQTNKDFVWLIIDDGSIDNTREIVDKWIKEDKIQIQYVYKENGGKHTAIEESNQLCETEYICCVDSDDYLSNDATQIIFEYIDKFKDNRDIIGFVGRRAHYNGQPFQNEWPERNTCIYFNELENKYNYTSETVLIFKRDLIKNFHFPIFQDERFVTESVFYNQFMYDYKLATITECIYLSEYQDGGYTAQGKGLFFKNPKGFIYSLKQNAYMEIKYNKRFKTKVRVAAYYYAWKKVLNIKNICKEYKLKFPYTILGKMASFILINKFNRQYKEFKQRQSK